MVPLKRPFFPGPGANSVVIQRGGSEWQWVLASVLRFVALLLIIAAIVYVVRAFLQSRGQARPATPWRSPGLDELDMRYARGEVARDEYLERRTDLLGLAPPPPAP
jgi:uncharacterized membrane protein